MKHTRRALAFTLALAMLLAMVTESVYAYEFVGPNQVWEDDIGYYSVATKAATKNFYKSLAIGKVGAALLDAVGECSNDADALEAATDVIFTAIMENDGSKSVGLATMGQGYVGAIKRCCINNKPIDTAATAAALFLEEFAADSAVASLGMGNVGAALMDAIAETGKGMMYKDENDTSAGFEFVTPYAIVLSGFAEKGIANSEAKCNALGVMGQGLVGAVKRCYINNKPEEHLSATAIFFVDSIARNSSTAAPAIGKIGAAVADAAGELHRGDTDRFTELRDGIQPVMDAFSARSVANSWDKCVGLGDLGQGAVGAMKRIYLNNSPNYDGVCSVAAVMSKIIVDNSSTAGRGLGLIGAAMSDSVGEKGHFEETYEYIKPVLDKFGEAAIAGSKDKCYALGILGQAEVGAIKRRYVGGETVPEKTTEVAIWIAEAIKNGSDAAAVPLGKIGAALMDTGGETREFANLKAQIAPVVEAFADSSVAKSEDRCMGLGTLGTAMVGAMKRYYMSAWDESDPSRLDAMTSVAGVMMDKIKSSDRKAAQALGTIGANLVDAVMETGDAALYTTVKPVMDEIATVGAVKSEGIGILGSALAATMKRRILNLGDNQMTPEMRSAVEWALREIDANDASKSKAIGMAGGALVDRVAEIPGLATEFCSEAGIVFDAISANDGGKSEALGNIGQKLITNIRTTSTSIEAMNTCAAIFIDAIAASEAAKSRNVTVVSDGYEEVDEDVWGISEVGSVLIGKAEGHPENLDSYCTAAGLFADAIEKVPVSKGESVCYVAGTLFFYIEPSAAEMLCSDAALVFNAIDANPAAKSAGIAKLGGGFLGSRQRAVLNAKDETILIEPFNTVLGYIEQIDEKNTYSRGGSGGNDYAEEVLPEAEHEPISDEELLEHFPDLVPGAWYFEGVRYVASHDIMKGTDKGFEPNAKASRAQIAQLLMNLDGTKPSGKTVALGDVHAGDWFAESVTWIVEKGIAKGQGLSFGVNGSITREDLAVLLYNYARFKGYDVSARGSVDGFSDVANMKDYAREALQWAVGVGLIQGTTDAKGNTILDSLGNATRGQIAIIMHRFCETVAKQPTATQNAK